MTDDSVKLEPMHSFHVPTKTGAPEPAEGWRDMRPSDDAIHALTNGQQQADMDGIMVKVSRQALDEVLTYVAAIDAHLPQTGDKA